ncbi:MAG TPA: ImmA/IrrE family metallo-endopeptidase [Symbiobacteriaceae bacterium]|nr:ImmA/IrrE family metallo-endopeptidase [Symbiobacteriaceae bacterium]
MHAVRTHAEAKAEEVLLNARSEFESLGEKLDAYQPDVELVAAIMFDLGVQQVPDLSVGEREYAGFLDVDAQLIVVEANHHQHRQRFSIAHEIGHFVLHFRDSGSPLRMFTCTPGDMETTRVPEGGNSRMAHVRREIEANQFASALLMPESSVKAMHRATSGSVIRMSKHFKVSPQAMEIRLSRLGLPFSPMRR